MASHPHTESDPTTSLNVSLPESLKRFVEARVADNGYTSASEYIRELIRAAKVHDERQGRLESKLLEALESGNFKDVTPEFFERLHRRAKRIPEGS